MSCGNPHETDCSEVLDRIHEFIDSELDEGTLVRIKVHLEECAPCLTEHDIEAAIKTIVARAGRSAAPDSLRARVVATLREVRVGGD